MNFLWDSATAAYQCEGAWNVDGKGLSMWDAFCHSDLNVSKITGDVSCDFFTIMRKIFACLKKVVKMLLDFPFLGQESFLMGLEK